MKSTDAQKRAARKYYEKHKDYYREKTKENIKKIRRERREYKRRIDETTDELKTANVDLDNIQLCEIIEYAIHILQNGSEKNEQ